MAEDFEPIPLQINDQLQITVKGTDEDVPTTYLSRVEDVKGSEISIGWPTNRGVRAPVHPGDVLCITYRAEAAVLATDARIVTRELEPIPLLIVRTEGPVRRIQRREFVRVPAMVEVELKSRVAAPFKPRAGELDPNIIVARTTDISGGGFAIKYNAQPQVGTVYDVKLTLPEAHKALFVSAKVVRVESVIEADRKYYVSGFAFFQISEALRRQIISFVFRFQQHSLAKE